ncbi:TonB-dependent receptor [Adhaeribacter sp. BT258]|uniref:TonB-dependent receptor n=1 Tax=Adhaeribacter terrigena TaxID=2793070 RepID=A0ABS1BZY8_9BACT|nr:TonB-dependent receptor [Adhaeribacter terrigena]MBK0402732.1 TonB-dependent receptor [Adhaeribacter terrigena]
MKKITKLFLLLFFISVTNLVLAQSKGRISGKLVEADAGIPVGFASVGLFAAKDSSLISGVTAAENGTFTFENLNFGNYYLYVTLLGYAPKTVPNLVLSNAKPELQLNAVKVVSNAKKLSEVEIVAQKDLVEYGLDKQVINVAKDISSTGGTASDALKNAPSVAVDIDGNVSVRGSSNVTVLVDGKNSGQNAQTILSQTPASAIERIEVITNPSAKYDAEGMGGIINIILKKEKKPGLNGNVMLNLGTAGNYNTSLGLNYNVKKFNFFGNYDFNQHSRDGYYQLLSYRQNNYLEQNQTSSRVGRSHIPKLGFDFQLSTSQTITLSAKSFINDMTEKEAVHNIALAREPLYFTRFGKTVNAVAATDLTFNYRKTFADKRREFTASGVYTNINGRFDRFIEHRPTNGARVPSGDEYYQNFPQDFHVKPLVAQMDYVHPVGEKGKFETGLKHAQRVLTSEFRTEQAGAGYTNLTMIDSLSNKFGFGDYINAAYANYANAWKKLNYQFGLRAEQTNIRINNFSDEDKYTTQYLDLFPSVFLSQEIDENRKVQLNYSRRVNRPNYEALNPFKNYTDQYNVWSGNPKIKPEYVDSYEASYVQFWKSGSFTNTVFYRNVHNLIQQVRYLDPARELVAYNTYVNLDDAKSYGLEISGSQALAKWWKLSGNVSAFNYKVSGKPLGVEANSDKFSWLARFNSNFTLPKDLSVQLSVNYRSPQALAQGTRDAIYNTDIALKKDVLHKKGSITLRVSDVFNTLRYNTSITSEDFTYDLFAKRQTRIAFIGFAYRFGNEQDKRRRPEVNNGPDGMF